MPQADAIQAKGRRVEGEAAQQQNEARLLQFFALQEKVGEIGARAEQVQQDADDDGCFHGLPDSKGLLNRQADMPTTLPVKVARGARL
jgi:hypothetical protein